MIEVKNLKKKYGSKYAVNDISFKVEKGKIYGLLGANGAGKSTTMNMITGYLAPSDGEIYIDGIDLFKEPSKAKKHIGYLPEIPPLYTEMSAAEYLAFCAELKKIPKSERNQAVLNVMEKTGLLENADRLIKNLSKGYRQRVGLAQALLGDPDIVILDEPTVGLDPVQIVEIRNLIASLKEKHTVILSSHILSEIESICDQIIIISKGHLVALDTPENLTKKSQNQIVLQVEIKGSKTETLNLLNSMEGIEKVSVLNNGLYEVICSNDVREELFFACAKANMPILSMTLDKASLEEVFIELTNSETDKGTNTDEEEDE